MKIGAVLGLAIALFPGARAAAAADLSAGDTAFLGELSRRSFLFFSEQTDKKTGITNDRAGADGVARIDDDGHTAGSLAATGFGLAALCVAAERGYLPRAEAADRARAALKFLAEDAPQDHGFLYRMVDPPTGKRIWNSELSSVDMAWLLAGALTARQCFDDPKISALAFSLYDRVDFRWMLGGNPPLLSQGWTPEKKFAGQSRWDTFSEHMLLDLLAIGAPNPAHRIPADVWKNWKRSAQSYGKYKYVADVAPLFIHQYSQAFIDFRGQKDELGINYFDNSVAATLAQRQFFADQSDKYPDYSINVWGGTASDTPTGYKAWGGPPNDGVDGLIAPAAAAGSLMFTPAESLAALLEMKRRWGGDIFRRYAFVDAFNPSRDPARRWTDKDVIGIDVGITLLSAANARDGLIWRVFMRNPEILAAMKAVGFHRAEN